MATHQPPLTVWSGRLLLALTAALVCAVIACSSSASTPTPNSQIEANFTRHSFGDGKSLELPEKWTVLAVEENIVDGFISGATAVFDINPSLETREQMSEAFAQAVTMYAVDQSSLGEFGVMSNISLAQIDLDNEVSLDSYFGQVAGRVDELHDEPLLETDERTIGSHRILYLRSPFTFDTHQFWSQQLFWADDGLFWILTITHQEEPVDEMHALGEKIIASIR